MNRQNALKLVHFGSTAWLIFCAAYMSVSALLHAGKSWLVIISLSGYSTPLVFLLISLYLFAIFRGASRSQKIKIEHPLTSSLYYLAFYDVVPFFGGLAGALGVLGLRGIHNYLPVIANGSLWSTFIAWIIVDPAAGSLEMLLPSNRKHRLKRLAEVKAARENECLAKQRLLAEIETKEKLERMHWNKVLQPYAEKLAALAAGNNTSNEYLEAEAVDIGVLAWQMGGINCMRQLHSMAMKICNAKYSNSITTDYISIWWDGIGNWRSHWLNGDSEPFTKVEKVLL